MSTSSFGTVLESITRQRGVRASLIVSESDGLIIDATLRFGQDGDRVAALAASERGVYPVIDARRREVFVEGPRAVSPDDLDLEPGTVCVGSGAIRYRSTFERLGAVVPPDDDTIHVPHARLHASLVSGFGPVDAIEPIYVRVPDAEATLA